MFKRSKVNINEIIDNLLVYFKRADYQGLDPSVLEISPKYLALMNHKNRYIKRIKASFWSRSFNLFGHRLHFLLEPFEKKHYYVKAICLYLMAKIKLDNFDDNDKKLLEILDELKIHETYLFSYPFTTYLLGEERTPNIPILVTTYFVAELYFQLFLKYKREEYSRYFKNVVDDVVETIPIFVKNKEEICFHYDTLSNYFVHNANLLAVEMITKYNFIFNDHDKLAEYNSLIERGLKYSLNDFRITGTYYYAGEETRRKHIDNYHTGYVLRSLNEINIYKNNKLKIDNLEPEISRLLEFYINTFIRQGPYIYRTKLKTIETHSLAESILIYTFFNDKIDEKTKTIYLNKIYKTLKILHRNKKFINLINTVFGIPFISDNSDYIRWAQAWILFGLSCFIRKGTDQK